MITDQMLFNFELEHHARDRSKDPRFDGSDIVPELDQSRLTGQIKRIFGLVKDGKYRTLSEISQLTGDGESSVSAQLRNLKKERFGSHTLNKRRRGYPQEGLWEYQLVINEANV